MGQFIGFGRLGVAGGPIAEGFSRSP